MPLRRPPLLTVIDIAGLLVLMALAGGIALARFPEDSPLAGLAVALLQVPVFLLLTLVVFLFINIFTADAYLQALAAASFTVVFFAAAIDAFRIVSAAGGCPPSLTMALRTVGILLAGVVVARVGGSFGRNGDILLHS